MAEQGSVVLRSFGAAKFEVPAPLALRSGLVAAAVGGGRRDVELPRDVTAKGVETLIAYWEGAAASSGADVGAFHGEFVGGLDHDEFVEFVRAARCLEDRDLIDLFVACKN